MAEVNTFYRAKRAVHLGNAVAEAIFTRADTPAAGQPVQVFLPDSGKIDGQGVTVIVRGSIIVGTNGNLTINLRVGNSVAGTLLAGSGAQALTTGNYQFELVFTGVWDSNSQQLRGRMSGFIGPNAIALAINSGAISGYNPAGTTNNSMPIVASALFSASNANNDVWITEFLAGLD